METPLARLRRRRRIVLVGLAGILAITIGSAIVVEETSSTRQQDLVHDIADAMIDAEALLAAMQTRAAAARGYLLSGSRTLLAERRQASEALDTHVERLAARLPDRALLAELRAAMEIHDELSDVAMTLRATSQPAAIAHWERQVRPAHQTVVRLAERFAATERARFVELRAQAAITARRARIWTIGSGLLVLGVVGWTVRTFAKMERELVRHVRQEQRHEMFQLLEQVPVGIFVIDAEGKPFYANQHAVTLIGHPIAPTDDVATAMGAYEIGTAREYPADRTPIMRALAGERSEISDMELRRDDDAIPLHMRGSPVMLDDRLAFAVAAFQDVRELRRIATRDALTGLPNRSGVMDTFTRERLLAERGDYRLALAMIDFDRFKSVNDTYGHAAGDQVLVRGSAAIAGALRRTDLLARWGGEELLVLLPKADASGAQSAIEKALAAVRALVMTASDERTFDVSFSAGIAVVQRGETLESAMARADAALYEAKRAGRSRVCMAPA